MKAATMTRIRFFCAVIVVVSCVSSAYAEQADTAHQAPSARSQLSDQELEQLVQRLGSDSYIERENAQQRLIDLGGVALPAVKEGMKSNDAEIRIRATRMIYPRITRRLYCKEMQAAMADALKKSSLVSELRDVMDDLRVAIETEDAKRGKESLSALTEQYHDLMRNSAQYQYGYGYQLPANTPAKEREAEAQAKEAKAHLEKVGVKSAELLAKANSIFEASFKSEALSKAGIVLKRINPSPTPVTSPPSPKNVNGPYSNYYYRHISQYPYSAEFEVGDKLISVAATPYSLSIQKVEDKKTGKIKTVSLEVGKLFRPLESAGTGKRHLLLPNGREIDSALDLYRGAVQLTHVFGSKLNGYQILHPYEPESGVAGTASMSPISLYSGQLRGVDQYLARKLGCTEKEVVGNDAYEAFRIPEYKLDAETEKRTREAVLVPHKGAELNFDQQNVPSQFGQYPYSYGYGY